MSDKIIKFNDSLVRIKSKCVLNIHLEGLEMENYTAQHATQQASQPIVAVELVGSTPCSYIYDVVVLYDDSIEVDREFAHKIIAILKMFGLQVGVCSTLNPLCRN